MKDIDSMFEQLLGMGIVKDDNSIMFSEESKQLIHEIAKECKQLDIVAETKAEADRYAKGLPAEDVFVDMLYKVAHAPTDFHRRASARMLIPIIDDKIRNGETGASGCGTKKANREEELDGSPFRWGGLGREFGRTAREWQEDGMEQYETCHLCKKDFDPDAYLYCATFRQPEGGVRFRIICRECAYRLGNVIEP